MGKRFIWTREEAEFFSKHIDAVGKKTRESLKNILPEPSCLLPVTELDQLKEAVRNLEKRIRFLENRK